MQFNVGVFILIVSPKVILKKRNKNQLFFLYLLQKVAISFQKTRTVALLAITPVGLYLKFCT